MFSTIFILLVNNQVPNPTQMASLIQTVSASEGVDPIAVTRIVIVESRGNPKAINHRTGDYGLMQVHLKSHPNVSFKCAMNTECGLRAGIRILKLAKRPCSYNIGNAKLTDLRLKICLRYEAKLASINLGGM